MNGFVAMNRTPETAVLRKMKPKAFLLLSLIAERARWMVEPCRITGLKQGQAMIGDFKEAGLKTRSEYRAALDYLRERVRFITTKTTTKGTIVTLIDSSVFSITVDSATIKTTTQQPSGSHLTTTKNKETKKQGNIPPISPKGEWGDIFPSGSLNRSKTEQKKIRVLKSNEKMSFIGQWFGRKTETLWSVHEASALRDLDPTRDEVRDMDVYRKTPNQFHRRDLITLLNNWRGELDRARSESIPKVDQRKSQAQERSSV